MDTRLERLDADWAWCPFEPTTDRPWSRRLAAHLMRRAGFGASSKQLDELQKSSSAELVHGLVHRQEPAEFSAQMQQLSRTLVAGNEPRSLTAGWLYRMLYTPHPLLEKMTLFWHGHFATSGAKVQNAELMLDQNRLLRQHALGSFADLALSMSQDPAMLIYLDSVTNRKSHPNENFARELLELFCLGLGNYGEQDIQELARCFTGWEVNLGKFRFNRFQADKGQKTLFGQRGAFRGEEGIRIVLEQPAAPRFIVGKLLRYLVADTEFPAHLVQPLADQLRAEQFQVRGVLQTILGSQLFFSEFSVARKIRSPIELAVGLLVSLEATANIGRLAEELAQLGQAAYFPPNVKGWDGGKTWINSATILGRGNLVRQLTTSSDVRFAGLKLPEYLSRQNIQSPEQGLDWLLELLVARPLPAPSRAQLIDLAQHDIGWEAIIHALSVMPEFHLS